MKCEANYCIYNRKLSCMLEEVEISSLGLCDSCIIVSIPENVLENLKETQLKEMERQWNNMPITNMEL